MRAAGEGDPDSVHDFAKGQRDEHGRPYPAEGEQDEHWEWEHGFWQGMQQAYAEGRWEEEEHEEEQPAEEE
jgi:hypothetical protein